METITRIIAIFLFALPFTTRQAFSDSGGGNEVGTRIVGGVVANENYPWMVSLQTAFGGAFRHFCGASLIRAKWVLTAAHCVLDTDPSSLRVVLGTQQLSNLVGSEAIPVKRIIVHENYNPDLLTNDIALLELNASSGATPVTLGDANVVLNENDMVRVIGWGTLQEGGQVPDNLYQVDVPIRTQTQCLQAYPQEPSVVSGNTLCAGLFEGGRDSCQGDSGGPLFFQQNGVYVQTGVVSWGIGCAREQLFGVYTHVGKYRAWVDGLVAGLFFDGPDTLGFVGVNSEFRQTVNISNGSTVPVTVQSVSVTGQDSASFTVDASGCLNKSIPVNGVCSVEVKVAPQRQGLLEAVVTAQFNSAAFPAASYTIQTQALPVADLGADLDNNAITWYSGGSANWMSEFNVDSESNSDIKSGIISDLQATAVVGDVEGPGGLAFNYRVSSENGYDFLHVGLDGLKQVSFSGEIGWQTYELTIPPGKHILSWVYAKDQSEAAGEDAAWIDKVVFDKLEEDGNLVVTPPKENESLEGNEPPGGVTAPLASSFDSTDILLMFMLLFCVQGSRYRLCWRYFP